MRYRKNRHSQNYGMDIMLIKELVKNSNKLPYHELCAALIERFGVSQKVTWESVLPYSDQQSLFGGEILRLISDHATFAMQKEIRAISLMKGDISQLLFFYIQLKDEKLSKTVIERITRKFIGGASADRYIIWFFGNVTADKLNIVITGKEGKKIKLKTLSLEAGLWYKTYDFILEEVHKGLNKGHDKGLKPLVEPLVEFEEPSELWKTLWRAFDISIINKRFYAEIKGVFEKLVKDELPKCKGILVNEGERIQFAIRLIGRIIFCWFLKKKEIIKDDVLSSKAVNVQYDYYSNLLELLFFEVLNSPIKKRQNLPNIIKDYPFLNGGLFEPCDEDHKGKGSRILNISNDWFHGFFDNTLEKYNFTVDENTSDNSEIAIDPEMLGRIFENLLAEQNPETGITAKNSTGSFYTPREIVDYMVEESLINYLKVHMKNKKMDDEIVDFVHALTLQDRLRQYSKELLTLLNDIKVLDPACGSGAFPIGILQKLVTLKLKLMDTIKEKNSKILYKIKLDTIKNSIYGIDIQPMAVELSRLRCWLSLVIDEDIDKVKENWGIEPLPNLDFKFVCADSLIGLPEYSYSLGESSDDIKKLLDLRNDYFISNGKEKKDIEERFTIIQEKMFSKAYEWGKKSQSSALSVWYPFKNKMTNWFDPEWMFGVRVGERRNQKNWKAYHITWVTHNSRVSERMVEFGIKTGEPFILDDEIRDNVWLYLNEKIKEKGYRVLELNILNDHAHCILVCEESECEEIVRNLKGYSSYMLARQLKLSVEGKGRQSKIWADGFSATYLQSEEHLNNAIEYVKNNHLKHDISPLQQRVSAEALENKSATSRFQQRASVEASKNESATSRFQQRASALCTLQHAFEPMVIKDGFDIVIANPPYVQLQKEKGRLGDMYMDCKYKTFERTGDIYALFYENGIYNLKAGGHLCFVTSNKWMRAGYGKSLRRFFNSQNPILLIDLGHW